MRPLRIFLWHVHGSYLYYLTQSPHQFIVPYREERAGDYAGRAGHMPWPDNLTEIPASQVRNAEFDLVLFQRPAQWLRDQDEILSEEQRRLPKIYLEHDPPLGHPTETRHLIDDPDTLLVHVTPFNALMWNSNRTPVRVIDHGAMVPPGVAYTGELDRGIVVINNLGRRGRRLGPDLYEDVRPQVPLDLVGMGSEDIPGGLGEVYLKSLPEFEARYRFFFNPIRYTSLGLAVCEAMMIGLPVIGLATTEMATVIQNGVTGHVDTDVRKLVLRMKELIADPKEARRLGNNARRYANERFDIRRFTRDWSAAFEEVAGRARLQVAVPAGTAS